MFFPVGTVRLASGVRILYPCFMRNLLGSILVVILLLWPLASAGPAAISAFQFQSFAEQCFRLLKAGRFEQLARLYHLPAGYPPERIRRERREITAGLERLTEVFGAPDGCAEVEGEAAMQLFELEGLDAGYWRDRPRSNRVACRTTFDRMGSGRVVFRIVVYDRRLQLRSVGFALPGGSKRAQRAGRELGRQPTE
ncbi:hypothetical protein EDC39_101167 [Geothermobacter ehrlichii]|uniref:Uncharacterized protein n=1 Tax=Geothermobacter ehrlichii TaxID=213224 RepID=A0A5D3WP75_9BACT|nr:hypothetical protein [Geothermobacter ehrlichii]TYP00007.1 hypothetical protein EDC39_101167 [Geothermobacter ehrlichii]